MAEKNGVIKFELLHPTGLYKEALVTIEEGETIAAADTITLDDPELFVNEIVSASAHLYGDSTAQTYEFADNVLTRGAGTAAREVVRIVFK